MKNRRSFFIFRVVLAYLITAVVVGVVLLALDKLPLLTEPFIAFKRIVLIAMAASMGTIVEDSFDKECSDSGSFQGGYCVF